MARYPVDVVTLRYRAPHVKFRRREPMAQLVREAVEEHRRRLDPQLALPLVRR